MKFSGKMCLMIILKVTKNQGFTLSLEDTFFEKPQRGVGVKLHRFTVKQFGFKLFLLLFERYCVSKRSLEAFSDDFCYTSRDDYTGQKSETPLREQIKFRADFKKR